MPFNQRACYLLLAVIVGGLLSFDVVAPECIERLVVPGRRARLIHGVTLGFTFGVIIGQLNLIGVWAALAPGKLVLRLPWSCILLTLMWYALVLGNHTTKWHKMQYATTIGVQLLAGFSVVQLPLWLASQQVGWRLVTVRRATSESMVTSQFNIRELIIAMGLLGVLCSLGRVILPTDDVTYWFDGPLAAIVAVLVFINLLVVVPCVWVAFASEHKLVRYLVTGTGLVLVASIVEFLVLCALFGRPGSNGEIAFAMFLCVNYGQCGIVLLVLALLRMAGFQLVRYNDDKVVPNDMRATAAMEASTRTDADPAEGPASADHGTVRQDPAGRKDGLESETGNESK